MLSFMRYDLIGWRSALFEMPSSSPVLKRW